jgi:hypothetical protein
MTDIVIASIARTPVAASTARSPTSPPTSWAASPFPLRLTAPG